MDTHKKQLILYRKDPAFISVIAMIPAVVFWGAAHQVTHYSSKAINKAVDKLIEKLSGLSFR